MLPLARSPLFCLGGNIYPVNPEFDWSSDKDVLVDAVRETHEAMRFHHWATLTPNRRWLECECVDPADHRDLLILGHAMMVDLVLSLDPEAPKKRAWRMPVNALFLRVMQSFAAFAFLEAVTLNIP